MILQFSCKQTVIKKSVVVKVLFFEALFHNGFLPFSFFHKRMGDCILKVNNVETVNVEHVIAVEALKSAGDEVVLVCNAERHMILINIYCFKLCFKNGILLEEKNCLQAKNFVFWTKVATVCLYKKLAGNSICLQYRKEPWIFHRRKQWKTMLLAGTKACSITYKESVTIIMFKFPDCQKASCTTDDSAAC